MRVALLGSGGVAGINFCKSINMDSEGIFTLGFDIDEYNIHRSVTDKNVLIDRSMDAKGRLNLINSECRKHKIDMIHGQPDAEVRFLLENKSKLDTKTFGHSIDEWNIYNNKLSCQKTWAKKLELDFLCYSLEEVLRKPKLFFNLQKQNSKIWFRAIRGAGSKAALPITSLEHAKSWAKYWVDVKNYSMEDFMLCEFLPGSEYAVQTLWINGDLIHSQCRERLVYLFGEIMPSGQSSTPSVAKTISDDRVYDIAHRSILATSSKPHGIYCVDLKVSSTGNLIPTEVNYGRFFTTSDFFASVGTNTPLAYCKYIMDGVEPKKQINSAIADAYWIRGIDSDPRLVFMD